MRYDGRKRFSAATTLQATMRAMFDPELHAAILVASGSKPNRSWRDGGGAYYGAIEAWRLKVLNSYKDGLHGRINERAAILARLQACARDGKVGLVESGRDCDSVDYVHPAGTIEPTLLAYFTRERHMREWADGPCHLSIVTPEDEEKTPWESHDRVLEAFENGHPHVVYSSHP